jgi:opacity protein-like surface antigen
MLLVALMATAVGASAQGPKSFTPTGTLGIRSTFNLDDISLGAEGGVTIPDYRSSLLLGFDGRLGSRRVVVPEAPGTYYILRERRWMLSLELEQRLKAAQLGDGLTLEPYLRLGGGLTWGGYRAFGLFKPHSGLTFLPGAGLALNVDDQFIVRLGYQYRSSYASSIEPHRLMVGGAFTF